MSSNINDDYTNLDQVGEIEFTLLGNEEVKRMSQIKGINEEANGI